MANHAPWSSSQDALQISRAVHWMRGAGRHWCHARRRRGESILATLDSGKPGEEGESLTLPVVVHLVSPCADEGADAVVGCG